MSADKPRNLPTGSMPEKSQQAEALEKLKELARAIGRQMARDECRACADRQRPILSDPD